MSVRGTVYVAAADVFLSVLKKMQWRRHEVLIGGEGGFRHRNASTPPPKKKVLLAFRPLRKILIRKEYVKFNT